MPDAPRPTPNALDPERMSAEERLREVGEILAAGLLRLRAKRGRESGDRRESSLDFSRDESVHGRRGGRRKRR